MDETGSGWNDRLRALFAEGPPRLIRRGEVLHTAGERLEHVHLIARGWIARLRHTEDGGSAFTGVYLAGDLVGADGIADGRLDDDLLALTDGSVHRIATAALREALARDAGAALALIGLLSADSGFLREALLAVGRRSSAERLCTFILQTYHRQVAAGLITPGTRRFALPLTQTQLAAVTGVTSVHLNRVLQLLRGAGCLDLRGGFVRVDDFAMLEREARSASAPVPPSAPAVGAA